MAIVFIAQVKGNGNDAFTTGSMDTSGASLLVATFTDIVLPTITDTYSNTWVQAKRYFPFAYSSNIYYAWNPIVGAGHSFTFTATDQFGSGQVSAFSGVDTSANPLDQTNENLAFGSTTVTPGTVTPTTDGQLVVAHDAFDNTSAMETVNGGFTSPAFGDLGSGGVYVGSGTTYLIQTTAAAANPTLTLANAPNRYATIATFKASTGPPPAATVTTIIMRPPGLLAPMGVLAPWTGVPAAGVEAIDLLVDDTVHAHTVDNLTLAEVHNLVVQDALHGRNGWVDLPGQTGDYLSTPDAAALDIVGDICLVAQIAPDDWTPAAAMTFISKATSAGDQWGYDFRLGTTGTLSIVWTTNGIAAGALSATSDANLGALAAGEWKWVAATLDVDNGAAQKAARFWTSDDGAVWTQLGTTKTTAGTTSIFNSNAALIVSGLGGGATQPFAGLVAHVSVRDGIGAAGVVGGSEVFRFDATIDLSGVDPEAATFLATTGQTVTVNRSGTPDTELVWRGGHTADNITLTQAHELVVADARSTHTVDNIVLTQVHVLVVADASHAHAADGLTLTQVHNLVVADGLHGHSADSLTLTQVHSLVVADGLHGHAADAVTLTQVHQLAVADASHGQTADNVVLTSETVLVVADATHAQSADNLTLTQVHSLVVAEARSTHTADNLTLTQVHQLVVADGLHAHTADNVTFTVAGTLTVTDGHHTHTADNVTLTQVHQLTVADGLHSHQSDNVTLVQASTLIVGDGLHPHSVDNVTLTQVHVLTVNGGVHNHTADGPLTLTQVHELVVADAVHTHTAGSLVLVDASRPPSVFRRWRIPADDRVLAPVHDRRIVVTATDLIATETSERLIADRPDTRIIEGDIP